MVCSASVSSSHTGHTFSADLAKTHQPPNDISTDTTISYVGGHVAFWLLDVVAIFRGTFFELVVVETPELPLLSTLFIIVPDIIIIIIIIRFLSMFSSS